MEDYGKSRVVMSVVSRLFLFAALLAVQNYSGEVWGGWVVMSVTIIVNLGEVALQLFVCLMGFFF